MTKIYVSEQVTRGEGIVINLQLARQGFWSRTKREVEFIIHYPGAIGEKVRVFVDGELKGQVNPNNENLSAYPHLPLWIKNPGLKRYIAFYEEVVRDKVKMAAPSVSRERESGPAVGETQSIIDSRKDPKLYRLYNGLFS